jgi:hypothetical protein
MFSLLVQNPFSKLCVASCPSYKSITNVIMDSSAIMHISLTWFGYNMFDE